MIVFDASTLILIAKIEILDKFLDGIGMEIAIPPAVHQECCGAKKSPDALLIQRAVDDSRIKIRSVRSSRISEKLKSDFNMGSGESEAIALALERKALLVGIDDKQGINACKLAGLPFVTALAILVRSAQKRLIEPDDALSRLSALATCGRYKKSIIDEAKRQLEERR